MPGWAHAKAAGVLALFWAASLAVTEYNTYLKDTAGLRAPHFVAMAGHTFTFAVALLHLCVANRSNNDSSEKGLSWPAWVCGLLVVGGACAGLDPALDNASSSSSLQDESRALLRALLPLACAVVAAVVERKMLSPLYWVAVVGVAIGLAETHYSESLSFPNEGVWLSLASLLAASMFLTAAGRALHLHSVPLLSVLVFVSLPAAAVSLPFFLAAAEYRDVSAFVGREGNTQTLVLLVGAMVFALARAVALLLLISFSSSVFSTVASNMLVALAAAFAFAADRDSVATERQFVGFCVLTAGFVLALVLESFSLCAPRDEDEDDDGYKAVDVRKKSKVDRPPVVIAQDKDILDRYDRLEDEERPLLVD